MPEYYAGIRYQSQAVSSELSEYEKQRLANIARNEAALAALGIGQV